MMLNTDMCMVFKNGGTRTLHATNDDKCCTWIEKDDVQELFPDFSDTEPFCGTTIGAVNDDEDIQRGICCSGNEDCDTGHLGSGPARQYVHEFINSENAFLLGYLDAWTMATENSYTSLTAIGDSSKVIKADGSKIYDYAALNEEDGDLDEYILIGVGVIVLLVVVVGLGRFLHKRRCSKVEKHTQEPNGPNATEIAIN
jgi:hypothetical protein